MVTPMEEKQIPIMDREKISAIIPISDADLAQYRPNLCISSAIGIISPIEAITNTAEESSLIKYARTRLPVLHAMRLYTLSSSRDVR